jgi:genome maintenance exonuclease 1
VDGKRLYLLPDGSRVPSVTTILGATQSEDKKQALNNWRKSVGVERAQAITTEAANRGTRMHKYLEDYIVEGALRDRGSNPYSWASHAMAEQVIEQGLTRVDQVWGVEVPLYVPGIYAGTADGAGVHCGDEAILDYKQTNKPKQRAWIDDYFVQLAAYAIAHNEVHGTDIRKGVILMCVKPPVDAATQEPTAVPQYQEFVVEGSEFDKYKDLWWKKVEQYYMQA